jgi:hypothetical protein
MDKFVGCLEFPREKWFLRVSKVENMKNEAERNAPVASRFGFTSVVKFPFRQLRDTHFSTTSFLKLSKI